MSNLFVTTGKKHVTYKEGDVWEEGGKTWTIKNGLKRTVNAMDSIRKEQYVPLACPRCGGSMRGATNEKIWAINQTCVNCLIEQEHKILSTGQWGEYEKNKILANAKAFCIDMESALQEYIQNSQSQAHVTEDGMIENWRDADKQHLKQVADKEVQQLKDTIENYKNK